MPTATEVLDELGTTLPYKQEAHCQQVNKSPEGFAGIEGAKEMVVFVPEENPEQLLDHPVLGPILRPYHDRGMLFAERRSPGDRSFGNTLKTDPLAIPVSGMGSVQTIYLISGSSAEGDPQGDEFPLHRKVRSSLAAVKGVIDDSVHEDRNSLAIYLDGQVLNHRNVNHYLRALGQGLGNLTYDADMYRTEPAERSVDGKLSNVEKTQLDLAKENGWNAPKECMTPEGEFAAMHKAVEKGEFELPKPETVVRSTRNAVRNVFIVSDAEGTINHKAILDSFEQGDMLSRVKSLCKFLSEAPHNLLDCELFVRVLNKLNEAVRAMGNNTEIEIYGPNIEGISVTGSLHDGGRNLNVLEAVHAGSGKELGPFMVRMKYRHPEAAGQAVHIVAGKSLMFDNGGNAPKGQHGDDMQGDMMGGASVASEFARFGEEKPVMNVDFVFGIASNKADGNARNNDDTMEHGSGIQVEERNPDAEGRQVLGDSLWAAMRRIHEDGEKIGSVLTLATLTGAAVQAGGHRTLAITSSRRLRTLIESISIANGDDMQPEALITSDGKATGHRRTKRADLANVDLRRLRGAQNAAAYIKIAAQLKDIPLLHFDIAPAMSADRDATPKDVQGAFACEGYLQTMHDYLMWLAQESAKPKEETA